MDVRSDFDPGTRNRSRIIADALATTAGRQHGLVTSRQIQAAGLSRSALSRRVASGSIRRIHRDVYALGVTALTRDARRMAVVLAYPEKSMLGSVSSIAARDFTRLRSRTLHVETAVPTKLRLDGVVSKQSTAAAEGHLDIVRGIPCASVAWAIAHSGPHLTSQQICHVIFQASWRRLVSVDEIQAILDRHPTIPGRARVVRAIEGFALGSRDTRSFLEDRFLEILHGVVGEERVPHVCVHVEAWGRSIEVDVPFLDRSLVLEVDGPPHDQPPQIAEDRARDRDLQVAGIRVERFHWTEIERRPCITERRLRDLVG